VLCTNSSGTPGICGPKKRISRLQQMTGNTHTHNVDDAQACLAQLLAQLLVLRAHEEVLRVAGAHRGGDAVRCAGGRLQAACEPVQPPRRIRRVCA
jgi:hypothetical protein